MYSDQDCLHICYSIVLDLRKTLTHIGLWVCREVFHSNSLDIPELTHLCSALKFISNYSAQGVALWLLSQVNMLPYQVFPNFRSFFLMAILSFIYITISRQWEYLLLNHFGRFIRGSDSLTEFFLMWKWFTPFVSFAFTVLHGPANARRRFALDSGISRHHRRSSMQSVSPQPSFPWQSPQHFYDY